MRFIGLREVFCFSSMAAVSMAAAHQKSETVEKNPPHIDDLPRRSENESDPFAWQTPKVMRKFPLLQLLLAFQEWEDRLVLFQRSRPILG